jgi:hypothetical protein
VSRKQCLLRFAAFRAFRWRESATNPRRFFDEGHLAEKPTIATPTFEFRFAFLRFLVRNSKELIYKVGKSFVLSRRFQFPPS